MSVYQWTGSNNADLGSGGNWVDTTEAGTGQPPGTTDVAIIEVGEGLYGTLNVAALDLVQASGAPPLSITGSSTQVTAASIGIAGDFTLDTGAYLQAGTMAIDGGDTSVTVQNNALIYDSAGENDVFDVGASTGNGSLLVTRGGNFYYDSTAASGTLNVGGVSNSVATLTVSDGGYFDTTLDSLNIGAHAGASGYLDVTGPDSQFIEDNYGYTTIGDYGELEGSAQGTVSVTNGAYASLSSDGEVDVGTSAGMAKILVSGANSAIEVGPYIEIGQYGTNIAGEVVVQAGGEFDTATDALLNNGTILVTGANSLFTARILAVDLGTTLTLGVGGLVHVADFESAGVASLTGGTLNVREALTEFSGSEITGHGDVIAVTLANAGRIIASRGELTVSSSITGTGSELIEAGATLELDGPVVVNQVVTFAGADGELALTSASTFKARISKFVAGDKLDIGGLAYVSGASATLSGYTLALKDGSATYDFRLRTTAASTYTVKADATGGTEIVASGAARALVHATAAFDAAQGAPMGQTALSASPAFTMAPVLAETSVSHQHYA